MRDRYRLNREEIQERVLEALRNGALMKDVAAWPGCPCRRTYSNWARTDPVFAGRLAHARALGLRRRRAALAEQRGFTDVRAGAVLARIRQGEPLPAIMKSMGLGRRVINGWKAESPGFARALTRATKRADHLRLKARHARRRADWTYTEAAGDAVIVRLLRGETLPAIWADPAMPSQLTIRRWRRENPDFDSQLRFGAKKGFYLRRAGKTGLTPELSSLIFDRLCEGQSLHSLSKRDDMPSLTTLQKWVRVHPDFARLVALAAAVRDDFLMGDAWIIAKTEESLPLAKSRIAAIRKRAGQLAPYPGQRRAEEEQG